jgi:hypothetical protein
VSLYLVPIEPPDPDQDVHHLPVTPLDLAHEGRTNWPHACPYQMVIIGNPGPHCHCCPVCIIQCQDELW